MNKQNLKVADAVMLFFTIRSWNNSRRADIKKIETSAEKKFLHLSKKLIDSKEYQLVTNYQGAVREWIKVNSVPSFFNKGAYLFKTSAVEMVDDYLTNQKNTLKERVFPLLIEFNTKIAEAQISLNDQFNPLDYPTIQELEDSFQFEWKWVVFDVPEGLPQKVFEKEKLKAENMWRESAEQISLCLRQAFVDLIKHANAMLQPGENGKTKGFKNSSFDNIDQFISSFKNRNIVDDKDLELLVSQAQKALTGINDPQSLKKDNVLRKTVSGEFKEISDKLSQMIETRASRKFSLTD